MRNQSDNTPERLKNTHRAWWFQIIQFRWRIFEHYQTWNDLLDILEDLPIRDTLQGGSNTLDQMKH
jgi:hypothetical protein